MKDSTAACVSSNEERLIAAQRIAHIGNWEYDIAHDKLWWSNEIFNIFEIDPAQFDASYEAFMQTVHPDDRDAVDKIYKDSIKNKTGYEIEHRLLLPDGRIKYVHEHCEHQFDEDANPVISIGTVQDITEHKKTQILLQQERDFSDLVIKMAPSIIVTLDPQGKIIHFNNYLELLSGYSLAEVKGKDWFETFLPESQREITKKLFLGAMNNIRTNGNVNAIITKEGKQKQIEWYDDTLKDSNGDIIGLISIGLDVTQREEDERNLKLFRTLIDKSNDSFEVLEPETFQFLDMNKTGCELLGYTKDEILTMKAFDIDPVFNKEMALRVEQEIDKTGHVNFETIHKRKDGSVFPVEVSTTYIELEKPYLLSIARDISERKLAEEKLKASEERYRLLVETTNDWVWEIDYNGLYTYVSPQVEILTGYKPQEVLGKSPFDLMSPQETQRVGSIFKKLVDNFEPIVALINTIICKDGTLKVLETSGVAFFDKNGDFLGYRGIDRDITERHNAEQHLRESEEKFRSITTSAQDGIIMMDDKGNISFWNDAAEHIFGHSAQEVMGQNLHSLIAPERFHEAHHIAFKHFVKTGEGAAVGKTLELSALKKDKTEFPVELSLSATMINGSWNAIGIIRDITERKEMQDELKLKEEMMIAQSKQAAMGDMIAMIAHQWRQPLAVISMDVNNLKASIELEEEVTTDELLKHADTVYEQLAQLSETIDNFRNFFKPDQSAQDTTIQEVFDATLKIIGKSLENNNIALNINSMSNKILHIHKISLTQVLLNIIANAKDIFVINKTPHATINVDIQDIEDGIAISICDNAGGIPDAVIGKLGQPYFTTKEELNGTGLGLYISKTILEKHLCGTLSWYNKDQGACFDITLKKVCL